MKRLPPAKRNQLIGVLLATLALIGLVYFMLISPQSRKNTALAVQIINAQGKRKQFESTVKMMGASTNTLAELTQQLQHAELDIASGDLYAWTLDTFIHGFKAGYKVEIPNPLPPTLGECDLISGFPYKQIRFRVTGTAFYHDLGKFVADFENKFPHCRILNLDLSSSSGSTEKLNFQMDICALVKPSN